MKQRKMGDDAVSPVIAVILMVAITVVLAATVFVLVAGIGKETKLAPKMVLHEDKGTSTLTVYQADANQKWSEWTVTGCTSPTGTDTVDPGDQLTACSGRVTVSHKESGTLVYEGEF